MPRKKFSTRELIGRALGTGLALGSAVVAGTCPRAGSRAAVGQSAQRATGPIELAAGAPDKHIVVKGDTLWDISATFLKSPWRWPEVWQLNRDQIANPHLIYPGEIRLSRPLRLVPETAARAAPRRGGQRRGRPRRRGAAVRAEPLDRSAISTVSTSAIEAFINRPLIVDEKGLAESPRIIATQEGRVYLGRGDRAYVRGIKADGASTWHVYRPAKPLIDPQADHLRSALPRHRAGRPQGRSDHRADRRQRRRDR